MTCPGEGLIGVSYNEILLILPSTLPTPVCFPRSLPAGPSVPIQPLAPLLGVTNRRNTTTEPFPSSRSSSGIGGGGGGGGRPHNYYAISRFNRGWLRSLLSSALTKGGSLS